MKASDEDNHNLVPWKLYLTITAESLLAFYIATFCIAVYYTHRGSGWIFQGVILGILYLFVLFVCARRVIQSLPLAALMLIIPLAPLIALTIVISLIPVLQYL
ncbi:hypothetical protein AQUSIP_17520 [Aquicella siphonis]|uniref:Uncharacterized protein n=1 Tax=Aquicella siphonis TaxID=254247 RepID=A0A5E4PHF7_9COXI|nr:hypothetical protein [Aquicella siphonis]VVC76439.1 hypothetical protein AQUSIP_17520 [Aquicella siphonis]